jgi:hypothetical protein
METLEEREERYKRAREEFLKKQKAENKAEPEAEQESCPSQPTKE